MAEKDSYWFKHDSTAGRGLRMRKMAHIYGHWGKGVYWDVIEILRDQANYCFNSDDSSLQMLCDLIGCKDEAKFLSWFKDCVNYELFEIENNKFFSAVLCRNMSRWESKKGNGSKGGRPAKTETITETKANRKLNETIIEDKIIEDKKIKKVSSKCFFKDSVYFDKNKFKEALPDWSKDMLAYYYESALAWSNEGNKKIDWIATVKTWYNRDMKKGDIKFEKRDPKRSEAPDYQAFIKG
jgi:hypothetical protein